MVDSVKPLTHEDLRIAALRFARNRKYDYTCHQPMGLSLSVIASETVTSANDIPDVIGWRNGFSYLIECKATRADFFADAKKPQRMDGSGMGNQRYFFTPIHLVKEEEVPEGWGLIELDGKKVEITKLAPKRSLDASGHANEKCVLLSLLRRIKMREFLIIELEAVGDGR